MVIPGHGQVGGTHAAPRARTRGIPDRCSPASTGTRWTRRDGSPSPRSSERSSPAARSSPAGWTLCLAIWPRDGLGAPRRQGRGAADRRERWSPAFSRFVFASAVEIEFDAQGRFVLPAYLREAVGLGSEAVVVGSLDHAEIWTPGRWDDYRKALEAPDALAQHLAGLGI